MSYRVECSVSGRATCSNAECKKAGVKIEKGALRLGTWVPYMDRGSWHWKHWGCVSGKVLLNLRKYLEGEGAHGSGVYRWDFLDGYDGDDKGSLEGHPDLQDKVRRVVTQGFIDPEDFKGDPEMNTLGVEGLRTKESKARAKAELAANTTTIQEMQQALADLTNERDELVAKGGNIKKIKKIDEQREKLSEQMNQKVHEAKGNNGQNGKRTRPDVDKEDADEPAKKKTKGKKGKKNEVEEDAVKKTPKKVAKKGKKVKKEESEDDMSDRISEDDAVSFVASPSPSDTEIVPAKKARGRKASVKKEESDEEEEIMPAKKVRGRKSSVKKEESGEEEEIMPAKKIRGTKVTTTKDDEGDEVAVKKARGKKAATLKDRDVFMDEIVPSAPMESAAAKDKSRKVKKGNTDPAVSASNSTKAPANATANKIAPRKSNKAKNEVAQDVKSTEIVTPASRKKVKAMPVKKTGKKNAEIEQEGGKDMELNGNELKARGIPENEEDEDIKMSDAEIDAEALTTQAGKARKRGAVKGKTKAKSNIK